MSGNRRIEWPPGSGVAADYSPTEQTILAAMIAAGERGAIDEDQLRREVGFLHDAKALLDATISDVEVPRVEYETAPPDSPFRIPPTAAAQLLFVA